jgi:glycosyltransferase involved in cell wall biosynthesis
MSEDFEFSIVPPKDREAMGGTELMMGRIEERIPKDLLDDVVIIPQRIRDEHMDNDKKKILWLHDLPEDPESAHLKDPESRKRFSKFVFPSNWALWDFHQKLGVPFEDSIVIKNGIVPIPIHEKPKDGKLKLTYFSTPHRGLNVLESVIRVMEQQRDDFEVDVYSSFKLYGRDEQDNHPEFKDLYDRLGELETVNYHGTVSNDIIRKALPETHILTYPSTYLETSCLVAIEAMAAGCLAVVPNYGALPETCKEFAVMYPWSQEDAMHAVTHYHYLNSAIDTFWNEGIQSILAMQATYFNYFYDIDMIARAWTLLLSSVLGRGVKTDD